MRGRSRMHYQFLTAINKDLVWKPQTARLVEHIFKHQKNQHRFKSVFFKNWKQSIEKLISENKAVVLEKIVLILENNPYFCTFHEFWFIIFPVEEK